MPPRPPPARLRPKAPPTMIGCNFGLGHLRALLVASDYRAIGAKVFVDELSRDDLARLRWPPFRGRRARAAGREPDANRRAPFFWLFRCADADSRANFGERVIDEGERLHAVASLVCDRRL